MKILILLGGDLIMAEKVQKAGITRENGYLYFVDKKGKAKQEVVEKTGVTKESGYLYFVDKQGDVSRAKMVRR